MNNEHAFPISGWIYLLKGPNNLYKIGYTKRNPIKRIIEYSPKLPFKTKLFISFPALFGIKTEHALHERLENKHIRGEWFKLTHDDIEYIKTCKRDADGEYAKTI
jgi:hypothetical protein